MDDITAEKIDSSSNDLSKTSYVIESEAFAAAIAFAPLHLFFNVIYAPPIAVKYIGAVGCLTLAWIFSPKREGALFPASLFGWCCLAAALCVAEVWQPKPDYDAVYLFAFTIVLGAIGFLAISNIDPKMLLDSLAVTLGIICLQIAARFTYLSEPDTREIAIGTLTYDSYPIFGTVSAMLALICLHRLREKIDRPALIGLALSAYILLNGQARGELASCILIAALSFFSIQRLTFWLPIFAITFYASITNSDFPIFVRFRLGLEAGFEDRFDLINKSISLLRDMDTLILGLGINGFQRKLDLEGGFYPHNALLEAFVSMGIVGALVYLLLFVAPVALSFFNLQQSGDTTAKQLWSVSALLLLVSFKSYSIFSNWMIMLFLPLSFIAMNRLCRDVRHCLPSAGGTGTDPAGAPASSDR